MRRGHGASRRRLAAGLLVLALAAAGCAGRLRPPPGPGALPAPAPLHPGRPLRVGVAVEATALDLRAGGPATLARPGGMVLGRFRRFRLTPPAAGGGLAIEPEGAERRILPDTLRVEPPPGRELELGGTAYRGAIEVFADGRGTLTAVNLVELEDYLLGVVPLEIGAPGPRSFEAVKAQAVAARTYTVAHLCRWPALGFALYGDVRDQAYGGRTAERPEASRAVEATAGLVATFRGRLAGAYYSAACGGMTAAVEETWPFPPEPYLRAHRDRRHGADFCRESKHYRWEERWPAGEFMDLVRRYVPVEFGQAAPAGRLEEVRVMARNSSGRVSRLLVRAGGREVVMGGDRVRWVLRRPGGGILRSSAFELEVVRRGGEVEAVVARGAGTGHGVGLCQAGALRMAAEGHDYTEILAHYYPGIRLERLRGPGLAWRLEAPAGARTGPSTRAPAGARAGPRTPGAVPPGPTCARRGGRGAGRWFAGDAGDEPGRGEAGRRATLRAPMSGRLRGPARPDPWRPSSCRLA